MEKDNYFQIQDFLQDESFVNWVNRTRQEDIEYWEQWLAENPGKRELAHEAAIMINGILFNPKQLPQADVESALHLLNQKIDQKLDEDVQTQQKHRGRRRWLSIAASFLVLIAAYLVFQGVYKGKEIYYETAFGEQIDIKLSDGTAVALNANSSLRWYSNHTREVWVEGEAFFKVKRKPETGAKFRVHTNDLVVEVLGTAFNVNSHAEKTQVVLEEGKVKLKLKNGTEKTMQPGDLISYSARIDQVLESKQSVRSALHTSWKDGTLMFDDISLEEAMKKIENTYGVKAIFKSELTAKRKITTGVPTIDLETCIKAFEIALDIEIEQNENHLIVY